MISTKIKIGLAVVLMASVSVPLLMQRKTNARLQEEIAALRSQERQSEPARKDPQGMAQSQVDADEWQRLRHEHSELMRLRGEVGVLRSGNEVLKRLLAEKQPPISSNASNTTPPPTPPHGFVPSDSWINAGLATPNATVQTALWAAKMKNVPAYANTLAWKDNALEKLEALFAEAPAKIKAKYASAVEWYVSESLARLPTPTGHRVAQQSRGAGWSELESQVEWELRFDDGQIRTNPSLFFRDADGWREVVNEGRILRFGVAVNGPPRRSRAAGH